MHVRFSIVHVLKKDVFAVTIRRGKGVTVLLAAETIKSNGSRAKLLLVGDQVSSAGPGRGRP
jgi:hypothetical protein